MIIVAILITLLAIMYLSSFMYFKHGSFKKFYHDVMGWHVPGGSVEFHGINTHSVCKHCGKEIMQDSQGNWF